MISAEAHRVRPLERHVDRLVAEPADLAATLHSFDCSAVRPAGASLAPWCVGHDDLQTLDTTKADVL